MNKIELIRSFITEYLKNEPRPIYSEIIDLLYQKYKITVSPDEVSKLCKEISKAQNISLDNIRQNLTRKQRERLEIADFADSQNITDEEVFLLHHHGFDFTLMAKTFSELYDGKIIDSKYFSTKFKNYCDTHGIDSSTYVGQKKLNMAALQVDVDIEHTSKLFQTIISDALKKSKQPIYTGQAEQPKVIKNEITAPTAEILHFLEEYLRKNPYPFYLELSNEIQEKFEVVLGPKKLANCCAQICAEKGITLKVPPHVIPKAKWQQIMLQDRANETITDEEIFVLHDKGIRFNDMCRIFYDLTGEIVETEYFEKKYKKYCKKHDLKPRKYKGSINYDWTELEKAPNFGKHSAFYQKAVTDPQKFSFDARIKSAQKLADPYKNLDR